MKQKRLVFNRCFKFGPLVSLFVTAAMLVWLITGACNVSTSLTSQQLKQHTTAIRRYVIQCYALEGHYPDSLDYLEDHYSLSLDRDRYVYHYRNLGANILPQIAVFALDNAD